MRSASTLSTQLQTMALYDTEPSAISALAEAFTKYFEDADTATTHVSITVVALRAANGPKAKMVAAMSGLSVAGKDAIAAGLVAFWGAMVTPTPPTLPAAYFTGATAIVAPAGLATVAAALAAAFATNTADSKSKSDSMDAIAAVLHNANASGTVTFPGLLTEIVA